MSKIKPNNHQQSPGFLSLLLIALFIIFSWQITAIFFPSKGPLDVIIESISFGRHSVALVLPLILLPVIISLFLIPITTYFFKRLWLYLKWQKFIRLLELLSKEHRGDHQELIPIQGFEVTSLPLVQQPLTHISFSDTYLSDHHESPYRYVHWVALHNEIKTATFEVEIGPLVGIRFWVPKQKKNNDDLQLLSSSLQTSYENLEFRNTSVDSLTSILGTSSFSPKIKKEIVKMGNEFLSILRLDGIPGHLGDGAQLDKLISSLIEINVKANLVVNFSPTKSRLMQLGLTKVKLEENSQRERSWFTKKSVDKQKESMTKQHPKQWEVSAYLVVKSKDEETHISKVKRIKIILETIYLNPSLQIKARILKGNTLQKALLRVLSRKPLKKTGTFSSRQLSFFIHLPQQAQPGYFRKHIAEFEVPPKRETEITLCNVMKGDRVLYPIGIDVSHLTTHMVVVGQTGKGKTRFVGHLIEQIKKLTNIGITIFDWKGEYQSLVKTEYIIGLESCPLKINLFETHGIDNVDEYVQNFVGLLRELLRMDVDDHLSTQMERILRESLSDYLNEGTGYYEGYEKFLTHWISSRKDRFANPESSIAGLINRFGKLFRGKLGYVFNTSMTSISFDSLLSEQVCFNLSNLTAYSKEDARLFLNALLMVIRTYLFRSFSRSLRYLVIAEEAQYLVPEVFTKRNSADASPIEDISLFQRAYGAGLIAITTRPNLISRNILANSSTKIFFQCPLDSNLVGDIINLSTEQRQFLTLMPERTIIAHFPWFEHPFKAQTCSFEFPDVVLIYHTHSAPPHQEDRIKPKNLPKYHEILLQTLKRDLMPLERHFLDGVCTELYKQEILHRTVEINNQAAIEIPRHQTLIIFENDPNNLDQTHFENLLKLTSNIILFCPPKNRTKIKERVIQILSDSQEPHLQTALIHLASLTRSKIHHLINQLKMGQLSNYQMRENNSLTVVKKSS